MTDEDQPDTAVAIKLVKQIRAAFPKAGPNEIHTLLEIARDAKKLCNEKVAVALQAQGASADPRSKTQRECHKAVGEFNRLWFEVHQAVCPWCIRKAARVLMDFRFDPNDAEDLASEALMQVYQNIEHYRGVHGGGSAATYLNIIMRRICIKRKDILEREPPIGGKTELALRSNQIEQAPSGFEQEDIIRIERFRKTVTAVSRPSLEVMLGEDPKITRSPKELRALAGCLNRHELVCMVCKPPLVPNARLYLKILFLREYARWPIAKIAQHYYRSTNPSEQNKVSQYAMRGYDLLCRAYAHAQAARSAPVQEARI